MRFFLSLLSFFLLIIANTKAQSIHRIACGGDLTKLDSALQGKSIKMKDNAGRSLLHWAVACRKKEIFDYLVEKGIAVDVEDNNGETALYVAVQFNITDYFDWLVALQPDETWVGKYGGQFMERAVLNGNQDFIEKLVGYGVDIDVKNDRGSTALEIAQRMGAENLAEWLKSRGADQDNVRQFQLSGKYLGQKPPGKTPKVFAPNFISTEESEFGSVFNARGDTFYFGVDINGKPEIRYSKRKNDRWTKPELFLAHEKYSFNDPFLSPDENRLYFISKRPIDGKGEPKDVDIWYVEKQGGAWSEPINAGPNINSTANEYYISFTSDGTMYFSSNINATKDFENSDYDIYYSKFVGGEFQQPVNLGPAINTSAYEADVFVAPDESYLIFCAQRHDSFGRGDLYISFKNEDDSWTQSMNMGDVINTRHHELCPFVSADGKYLFYTSDQDIYWVSTEIIQELKSKTAK